MGKTQLHLCEPNISWKLFGQKVFFLIEHLVPSSWTLMLQRTQFGNTSWEHETME